MAHFASINSDKIVRRVVVIGNDEVDANGGDQSAQAAEYVRTVVPFIKDEVQWVQTSYNRNFRVNYAMAGGKYEESSDMFITPPSFPSWTYDDSLKTYVPPVAKPTNGDDGTVDFRFKDTNVTSIEDGGGTVVEFNDGYPLPMFWSEERTTWASLDSLDVARYWNPSSQTWEI
jgi:hypothetical protein|tara:strand:+ start:211 stop:729 length:519 start_codon:yes stop_codon:yes gene_type:complete